MVQHGLLTGCNAQPTTTSLRKSNVSLYSRHTTGRTEIKGPRRLIVIKSERKERNEQIEPFRGIGKDGGKRRQFIGTAFFIGLFNSLSFSEASEAAEISSLPSTSTARVDKTITDRVYFDFNVCPTAFRQDRTLGNPKLICDDGEQIGRVVIGLYGNQVPITVSNFKSMVDGSAGSTYKGTVIHKIMPGEYIQAGKQGSVDRGEVGPPRNVPRNLEAVESKAFLLDHNRPGTVSLSLGTNDDDVDRKLEEDYRNVEFLITTGPGPAPQLDSGNIVFGTVLEGMDVITRISGIPTFRPSENIRQFNDFAELIGDDRAQKGRIMWNRPLKAIVIQDCGILS